MFDGRSDIYVTRALFPGFRIRFIRNCVCATIQIPKSMIILYEVVAVFVNPCVVECLTVWWINLCTVVYHLSNCLMQTELLSNVLTVCYKAQDPKKFTVRCLPPHLCINHWLVVLPVAHFGILGRSVLPVVAPPPKSKQWSVIEK